ncbi:hypothetical protein [Labrys miyagiensis]|uniref:hypothetical protein n=1 Tax=Labrys miyagiensis TaxID=346912 RepID=UPI0024E19828|nr:hypothetical protein [Labrys miyagiensis]
MFGIHDTKSGPIPPLAAGPLRAGCLLGVQSLYGEAHAPTMITATPIIAPLAPPLFLPLQKHFVGGLAPETGG